MATCLKYNDANAIYGSDSFEYYFEEECIPSNIEKETITTFNVFKRIEKEIETTLNVFKGFITKETSTSFRIINHIEKEVSTKFNAVGYDGFVVKEVTTSFLIEEYDPSNYQATCNFESINFLPENLRDGKNKELYSKYCEILDYVICKHHYENISYLNALYDITHEKFNSDAILKMLGSLPTLYEELTEHQKETVVLVISNLYKIKGTKKSLQFILRLLKLDAKIFEWHEINELHNQGDPNWPEIFEPCSIAIEAIVHTFGSESSVENKLRSLFSEFLWTCVKLAEFRWKFGLEEDYNFEEIFDSPLEFEISQYLKEYVDIGRPNYFDMCPDVPEVQIKTYTGTEVIRYNDLQAVYDNDGKFYYYDESAVSNILVNENQEFFYQSDINDNTLIYGYSLLKKDYDYVLSQNNGIFPCDVINSLSYEIPVEANFEIQTSFSDEYNVDSEVNRYLQPGETSLKYNDINLYYSLEQLEKVTESISICIIEEEQETAITYNDSRAIYGDIDFEYYTQVDYYNYSKNCNNGEKWEFDGENWNIPQ